LRGDHNLLNVLAAFAIGHAAGFPLDAMLESVEDFRGVPHRLELVRELRGVRWYNDSTSSAPERSIAAIRAFDEPIVLLLGGRDKDLPWEELMQLVNERVDHVSVRRGGRQDPENGGEPGPRDPLHRHAVTYVRQPQSGGSGGVRRCRFVIAGRDEFR
jgi:UDP-N-acetylmuramoylalanine-D-glutamate ligase